MWFETCKLVLWPLYVCHGLCSLFAYKGRIFWNYWIECSLYICLVHLTLSMVQVHAFCQDIESGILTPLTVTVLLSTSLFKSVSICLIYLGSAVLGADTFTVVIYFDELIPLSLCNNFVSCYHIPLKVYFVWYKDSYSALFSFPLAWNMFFFFFFHPFTWSLFVSINLK